MTPTILRDRFRRQVDDVLLDPSDDSAALWTDEDILYYMNEALSRFVHDTLYLTETIELTVVADDAVVTLPERVISIRDDRGYLVERKQEIRDVAYSQASGGFTDDYGYSISGARLDPLADMPSGRPRAYSADIDSHELRLFPPSDTDDTLRVNVYVEAAELEDFDAELPIKNPRHARMLLNGMKALAYEKQDAEVYDPKQANRFELQFAADIAQVAGERMRRRRQPQPIPYGGL